jgi:hypothetical protein
MWWFFLLVYCSYLILGPHWETKFIRGEKLEVVDSLKELGRRSIFVSYVALLFMAWFLYSPSMSSFVSALMLIGAATSGFYVKYGSETVPMHLLLLLFILYRGSSYMTPQLWATIALIGFYTTVHDKIYIS